MTTATVVGCFVDGAWGPATSQRFTDATSPADDTVIGAIAEGTAEDVDRAVVAAQRAAAGWAADGTCRAAVLRRTAEVVMQRVGELQRICVLDQGKPLAEARDELFELAQHLRDAADHADRPAVRHERSTLDDATAMLVRRPLGVVGAITPWNWPFTMPAELLAPALAAGNTAVWVPAPSTSVCAHALMQCFETAGLPPGVLNLVPGPGPVVGDALARHPDVQGIGFIGSVPTGRAVAAAAAGKALLLELGGNGPFVVLEDADLDLAVDHALTACFLCAGQSCTAGERLLVHRDVHDAFVERLVERTAAEVVLGDPLDPATTLGPVHDDATAAKMDAHVADAVARGATVHTGGRRSWGRFWPATVLTDVPHDALAMTEETFGPIAPIARIDSLEEAIERTNASPYGLLAAIFTADLDRGRRFAAAVKSGWVNVNVGTNHWELHLPFGGGARSVSGVGRVGATAVLDAFSERQTVVVAPG